MDNPCTNCEANHIPQGFDDGEYPGCPYEDECPKLEEFKQQECRERRL